MVEKEKYIKNSINPLTIKNLNIIQTQMENHICKIHKNGENGTGFLCSIPLEGKNKYIPMLITNKHILGEGDLKIGKEITISFNNDDVFKTIIIGNNRKIFTPRFLDVTFIEILKKDQLNIKNFLQIDERVINKKNFVDIFTKNSIYVLNYPKGKNIVASLGIINKIENNDIYHSCITDYGSSGSPILSLENFKVIGIHYGSDKKSEFNNGIFMKNAINQFYSNFLRKMKIIKNLTF